MNDPKALPTTVEGNGRDEWFYATRPTRWTLFLRTFLPWQAWRFLWINFKMIGIIRRGHRTR